VFSTGNAILEMVCDGDISEALGTVRSYIGSTTTKYTYTGQYSYATGVANEFGLMYYGARFYDPTLGRFAQADTIIPGAGNPGAWDRYAYLRHEVAGSIVLQRQDLPFHRQYPTGTWEAGNGLL
jgi:RHS repeat-associated protein